MQLNHQIGGESNICLAIYRIRFPLPVQILNALAWRNVQIGQEGCNVGVMTANDSHFGGVGFYEPDSVFAFVDYFLEFVCIDEMGKLPWHDEGVVPGVEVLKVSIVFFW